MTKKCTTGKSEVTIPTLKEWHPEGDAPLVGEKRVLWEGVKYTCVAVSPQKVLAWASTLDPRLSGREGERIPYAVWVANEA
jgi:hypothetical protein